MPVHEIRLRRGWTRRFQGGAERLDLPIPPAHLPHAPFTIERSYRFPALQAGDSVRLHVDHAPGILEIRIDDRPTLPSQPIPTAGRLLLRVDPDAARSGPSGPEGWGDLRLVIRSTDVAGRRADPLP